MGNWGEPKHTNHGNIALVHTVPTVSKGLTPLISNNIYLYALSREDLVYDKHTGSLIGYTDLGEVNNHLLAFERSLDSSPDQLAPAKSMLTFMVKGLFTNLQFPYVQFSSTKLTGDSLFQLFWEVVKRVERIGLKVHNIILTNITKYKQTIRTCM